MFLIPRICMSFLYFIANCRFSFLVRDILVIWFPLSKCPRRGEGVIFHNDKKTSMFGMTVVDVSLNFFLRNKDGGWRCIRNTFVERVKWFSIKFTRIHCTTTHSQTVPCSPFHSSTPSTTYQQQTWCTGSWEGCSCQWGRQAGPPSGTRSQSQQRCRQFRRRAPGWVCPPGGGTSDRQSLCATPEKWN